MKFIKNFIPLISTIILTGIAFYADIGWENKFHYVIQNKKEVFHFAYAIVIGLSLAYLCKIFNVSHIWQNIKFYWNKRKLNLGYLQDSDKFSSRIKKQLIGNQSNKYLIKCFDSLYLLIRLKKLCIV